MNIMVLHAVNSEDLGNLGADIGFQQVIQSEEEAANFPRRNAMGDELKSLVLVQVETNDINVVVSIKLKRLFGEPEPMSIWQKLFGSKTSGNSRWQKVRSWEVAGVEYTDDILENPAADGQDTGPLLKAKVGQRFQFEERKLSIAEQVAKENAAA